MPDLLLQCAVAFVTAAATCYLIVRSGSWHLWFTADHPGTEPQKFHTEPVPRIGGLGLLLGMVAAGLLLGLPRAEFQLYWLLMLSLLPAFAGGLMEDLTRRVGPTPRLLMTFVTASIAFGLAGVQFVRSDVAWLDQALAFLPFGYLALLFAVGGLAHAINIIDGHHGLAGGATTIILVAMGAVAAQSGDELVAAFCNVSAAATFGFLLLNYPRGQLFLGDGGAYLLGSVIALGGALLILRNPAVSPWFPLALAIYPVWETLFSVIRRALVHGTGVGEADARHLHSLVYRRIAGRWVNGQTAEALTRRNSLTALPFWFASLVIAGFAVAWSDSTAALGLLTAAFVAAYTLLYWRLGRWRVQRKGAAERADIGALTPVSERD